ncbi:hypothetical protein Bhyg_04221 [Pseudolycoriella hygida]|uniref:Uncharacterized protein n=1 Tax=Pseudolycoriella hygida TaxID=35572 RepID=A0A9Q0NES8_9DIPT|nr:hypothetical protein Bhyg_04221 [Pseudolycoriella hygida]
MFVNTLLPSEGNENYGNIDLPIFDRSLKTKGMMNMTTITSEEREQRLRDHQDKMRKEYAAMKATYVALRRQSEDLTNDVCLSCMELCFQRDVQHIDTFEPHSSVRRLQDDLLDEHEKHNYRYGRLPSSAENILDGLEHEEDIQFNLNNIRSQTEEKPTVAPSMLTQKDVDDSFYEQVTLHSIGVERPNEEPSTCNQQRLRRWYNAK